MFIMIKLLQEKALRLSIVTCLTFNLMVSNQSSTAQVLSAVTLIHKNLICIRKVMRISLPQSD